MDTDSEWMTMAAAARLIGYRRTSVYALVQRGVLAARAFGPRATMLRRADVLTFAERAKRGKGRPRTRPADEDGE